VGECFSSKGEEKEKKQKELSHNSDSFSTFIFGCVLLLFMFLRKHMPGLPQTKNLPALSFECGDYKRHHHHPAQLFFFKSSESMAL
jgi:hypothetical protein